jgi:hypothetical protein
MLYVDTTPKPADGVYVNVLTPVGAAAIAATSDQFDTGRADINPGRVHSATTITGGPRR